MALRFAGKHCAVIGATGVIGSHIARAFAANGALVSSFGRTALEAQPKLEAEMTPYTPTPGAEHLPAKHQFVPLNILDHQDIDRVFKGRDATTGDVPPQVDILVNCAGISQDSFLKMASNEHLKDIIDTNLTASLLLCKVVKMQKAGCIINVSSLMATKGAVGAVAYAASKAGILGLTRALCLEYRVRKVRVNALLPGWVQSPMWDTLKPKLKEAYLQDTPLHRVAHPDEVADAAMFLAANQFANNCVLNLDGGLSAA